jgi:hypothetical protein
MKQKKLVHLKITRGQVVHFGSAAGKTNDTQTIEAEVRRLGLAREAKIGSVGSVQGRKHDQGHPRATSSPLLVSRRTSSEEVEIHGKALSVRQEH